MRAPLVVVYDVSRDRDRALVATGLRRAGALWIQQSAWVLAPVRRLDPEALLRQLSSALERGDRLWAYEPCPRCERGARWLPARVPGTSPFRVEPFTLVLPMTDGDTTE